MVASERRIYSRIRGPMSDSLPRIVVAGDVTIDWLAYSVPPRDRPPMADEVGSAEGEAEELPLANWQFYEGTEMVAREGGAMHLANCIRAAVDEPVAAHVLERPITDIPFDEVIHSIVELAKFPLSTAPEHQEDEKKVYRVRRLRGFCGPREGEVTLPPIPKDDPNAEVVVLDDAGNGFRGFDEAWPLALRTEGKRPIVILKMSRPVGSGALWQHVRKIDPGHLLGIVNADDLRVEEGVDISRGLSWERTATDLLWQLSSNPRLRGLANCRNLIVRFGVEGAVFYSQTPGRVRACLFYDPEMVEGGFRSRCEGKMLGLTNAFVAVITAHVAETRSLERVYEAIPRAIRRSRRVYLRGFGRDRGAIEYPGRECLGPSPEEAAVDDEEKMLGRVAEVRIPVLERENGEDTPEKKSDAEGEKAPARALDEENPADPGYWCILDELRGTGLEEAAYSIVLTGNLKALENVPVATIGDLRTADRAEMEGFRTIRRLILQYVRRPKVKRPLCLAVFGPPGSGKSFGVKQVAKSVKEADVESIEFNLSQFEGYADLVGAFHLVRDIVLRGKLPLVFFDEFDSAHDGELGWLKLLLAPMQDGSFKEGGAIHPIGKAVFVFAGGTSESYRDFAEKASKRKAAKGSDFLSRLRGYVDIRGPDPVHDEEEVFLVRRALILRSLLETHCEQLLDRKKRLAIDDGILRALIKVREYEHGIRSIEAILEMSRLAGATRFDQAALPPANQLAQHVDPKAFSRLLKRDVLLGGMREKLGRAVHEQYRKDHKDDRPADDPAMQPWEDLLEQLKESNLRQADDIPRKLRAVRCGFQPSEGPFEPIEFDPEEIEKLAKLEKERFNAERGEAGWTYGPERDAANKVSPYLVPWEALPEKIKDYDRDAVRVIPEMLAAAGFEVYRLTRDGRTSRRCSED